MALSGCVNFALAYTITIIIQCILTWFVKMGLVSYDLSKRSVQPIGFIREPLCQWLPWLFFLPPASDPGDSEVEEKEPQPESKVPPVLTIIVQGALRGFILAVLGFFILWPLSVAVLTTVRERDSGD
ncbi:uncharacterized protein BKA55DRAFT_547285 [Fusarium redolens]|uniref:Uncharacterized protein n=1 Tax=Fusarium redolens TaxID=48865 RepID=A0A9P9FWN8_FUSRE|nr:uncharacterized protein BKA55DRAFT_547285 [Fusarium redolens]KAH7205119.1 hypothetical protein BKA55DRAFT_547285 [Fusarium redolens]